MIVNLISGPRNVSTALMYSFAQRKDTVVLDEPFYAYYLNKTGIFHPGREEILASMSSDIHRITSELQSDDEPGKVIFLKNMAHHHLKIDPLFLRSVKNIFLIRNPAELIASFSKVIEHPTMDDIGIKKSLELYQQLMEEGQMPVVMDSGELLKNPSAMLEKLCHSVGLEYDKKMESWPVGPRKEDGVWAKYWYENVHKSSGFKKPEPKITSVPDHLLSLYQESIPYYNELYSVSIKY